MTIVNFKFDKEKDMHNIWETANSKLSYGYDFKKDLSKITLSICHNKKYEKCKKSLTNSMNHIYKSSWPKLIYNSFNQNWSKIEKEYFRRLEKITKTKFPFKKINAYLTTSSRCPYNPNKKGPYFFVKFFSNIPSALHVAGHELMHIHLHNNGWWEKFEKEIGNDKTHDLKESLTELLNLEFQDLWVVHDPSYPNHENLRKYISQQWKRKKDFDLLTENCIKWIKKNGIK